MRNPELSPARMVRQRSRGGVRAGQVVRRSGSVFHDRGKTGFQLSQRSGFERGQSEQLPSVGRMLFAYSKVTEQGQELQV